MSLTPYAILPTFNCDILICYDIQMTCGLFESQRITYERFKTYVQIIYRAQWTQ